MQFGEMNDRFDWDVVEIGWRERTNICKGEIDQLLTM